MKLFCLAIAVLGLSAAFWPAQRTQQIVILSGDADGNLAPCGCTKPMTGGIKRRIQAAKELSVPGHTTLVDNGNFVAGVGRQDQIKAQTMAEILGAAGYDAINIGPFDARLGLGMLLSMNSLAQGKFVASELAPTGQEDFNQSIISGPFLIIGISANADQVSQPLGRASADNDSSIKEAVANARAANLSTVLLFQGNHDAAKQIAQKYPDLALIEYRSEGSPPEHMEMIGKTALVSPGSDGKYLIRLEYNTGNWEGYQAVALGPQYKDDPTAARLYRNYLNRINSEKLVDQLPRMQTAAYVGSKSCGSCHKQAVNVWQHSLHSHALTTLEGRGHDRDPECLPCHVVGLTSTKGFLSSRLTPNLAGVGCESCHGPGAAHAASPKTIRIPKVSENTCLNCHTSNTSPNFTFAAFWKKVKH